MVNKIKQFVDKNWSNWFFKDWDYFFNMDWVYWFVLIVIGFFLDY